MRIYLLLCAAAMASLPIALPAHAAGMPEANTPLIEGDIPSGAKDAVIADLWSFVSERTKIQRLGISPPHIVFLRQEQWGNIAMVFETSGDLIIMDPELFSFGEKINPSTGIRYPDNSGIGEYMLGIDMLRFALLRKGVPGKEWACKLVYRDQLLYRLKRFLIEKGFSLNFRDFFPQPPDVDEFLDLCMGEPRPYAAHVPSPGTEGK